MVIPPSFSVYHWGQICWPCVGPALKAIERSAARLCRLVVEARTGDGLRNVSWKKWSRTFLIRPKASKPARRIAGVLQRQDRAPCRLHRSISQRRRRSKTSRMLKKSLFSRPQPRRAETRLSPGGILVSLRGSTLKRAFRKSETLEELIRSPRSILGVNSPHEVRYVPPRSSLTAALPAERRVLPRRGWEGENRGPFEHPATLETSAPYGRFIRSFMHQPSFSAAY